MVGDLFVGMSYGWWQHKHTRHHANPNKEGVDPDIDLPVVSFTPAQVDGAHDPLVRWLIGHQGWFFFPVLLLEGLSLHASSVRRVFAREPMQRRPVEIAFLAVRIVGYLALVFLVLSPGKAAVFLAVQLGLFGIYMGSPSPRTTRGCRWSARRQARLPEPPGADEPQHPGQPVLDFMMGGLNYQIEHHLFPSMPRPHLRRAAPDHPRVLRRARRALHADGTLIESYVIVTRYINRVGLGEKDPFACPLLEQRATPGAYHPHRRPLARLPGHRAGDPAAERGRRELRRYIMAVIIILLVVWAALGVVGFAFDGLLWLGIVAAILFIGTLAFGIAQRANHRTP